MATFHGKTGKFQNHIGSGFRFEVSDELDGTEITIVWQHSFEIYQILKQVRGFEEISSWVAYHHDALDGCGYPFHLGEDDLDLEAHIVAASDVFQTWPEHGLIVRPFYPRKSCERRNIGSGADAWMRIW